MFYQNKYLFLRIFKSPEIMFVFIVFFILVEPLSATFNPNKTFTYKVNANQVDNKIINNDIGLSNFNIEQKKYFVDFLNDKKNLVDDKKNNYKKIIILDAGHGGFDEGTIHNDIFEKDINLKIVLEIEKFLLEQGYTVLLTRKDDFYVDKFERIEFANNSNADVLISIHQNYYENNEINGIEIINSDQNTSENNKNLTSTINKYMTENYKVYDNGIKNDEEIEILSKINIPSCIIKTSYLSNDNDLKNITDLNYVNELSNNISKSIIRFLDTIEIDSNNERLVTFADNEKIMHLTFDDGPSKTNTPIILDILKERNIKATFFLIASNVEKYPEIVKRIIEEGHEIGIHCYNHNYNEIYKSVDSFLEDFNKASDIIEEVTGLRPKILRFPGGSINNYNKLVYKNIIDEMNASGYTYYDWNASIEDTGKNKSKEAFLKNAVDSSLLRNRIVMLAHDTVPLTSDILNDLIDLFPDYEYKTIIPEYEPITFK